MIVAAGEFPALLRATTLIEYLVEGLRRLMVYLVLVVVPADFHFFAFFDPFTCLTEIR